MSFTTETDQSTSTTDSSATTSCEIDIQALSGTPQTCEEVTESEPGMKFQKWVDLPETERLTQEMKDFLINERSQYTCDLGIAIAELFYANRRSEYKAPQASLVDHIGAIAVLKLCVYHRFGHTYQEILDIIRQDERDNDRCNNPFFCNWFSKTDDASIITQDTTGINSDSQGAASVLTKVNDIIKKHCRVRFDDKTIDIPMKLPYSILEQREFSSAASRLAKLLWIYPLGANQESDWRYCRSLPLLAGLGIDALRAVLRRVAEHSEDSQALHLAGLDPVELRKEICTARISSGYGVGMLYADGADILSSIDESLDIFSPIWVKPLVAAHVLKYTRLDLRNLSEPVLVIQRLGKRNRIVLDPTELHSPFAASGSVRQKSSFLQMLDVLGFRVSANKDQRTPIQKAILAAFHEILPTDLPAQIGWDDRLDVIEGPEAQIISTPPAPITQPRPFVQTCCAIDGYAILGRDGTVAEEEISGHASLTRYANIVPAQTHNGAQWKLNLPSKVEPINPARLLPEAFKNLRTLGHPDGFACVMLAVWVVDQLRRNPLLMGSAFATTARVEYPILYVLPESAQISKGTNSGKTTFAVTLGRVFHPGLDHAINMSRNVSAPALRSSFVQFTTYGTSVLDEFLLPSSPEHPLCKDSLQSIVTGGKTSVGKVGDTHPGVMLSHPMVISSKLYWEPRYPDLRNRTIPIFIGNLDETNRASSEYLTNITSGKLSQGLVLGTRLFITRHQLIQKLKDLELPSVDGNHRRWRLHYAVARLIAQVTNVNPDEIDGYLNKAHDAAAQHFDGSLESGLASAMNIGVPFSIESALNDIDAIKAYTFAPLGTKEKQIPISKLLEAVGITNNGRSEYGRIYGDTVNELTELLANGKVDFKGITLHSIGPGPSKGAGRKRPMMVVVSNNTNIE